MPWALVEVDNQGDNPKHYAPALQLRFIAGSESFSAPLPSRFHQKVAGARQGSDPRLVRTDSLRAASELVLRPPEPSSPSVRRDPPVSSGVKRLIVSPRVPSSDRIRDVLDAHAAPMPAKDSPRSARKESPRLAAPKSSPRVIMSPRVAPSNLLGSSRGIRTPRARIEEDSQWIKRKNTIGQLMKRLQAKNWNTRKLALESLASFVAEDVSVLEGVVGLLEAKNSKTRETAVWAISRIVNKGDRAAVSHLLRRLEHTVPEVRLASLAALSQVAHKGDNDTVAGIVERLSHSDWQVREVAADALSQLAGLGDGPAIEGLINLLSDKDWRVRPVALEALETLVNRSYSALLPLANYLSGQLQSQTEEGESGKRHTAMRVFNIMTRVINPTSPRCQECTSNDSPDRLCSKCVDRIAVWISSTLLPPFWIAFLMGGHARLGEASFIYHLDASLYPLILRHCRVDRATS